MLLKVIMVMIVMMMEKGVMVGILEVMMVVNVVTMVMKEQ